MEWSIVVIIRRKKELSDGPKVDRTTGPSQPLLTRPTRYGARRSARRPRGSGNGGGSSASARFPVAVTPPPSQAPLSPRINGRSLSIPFVVSSRLALGLDSPPASLRLNPQDFSLLPLLLPAWAGGRAPSGSGGRPIYIRARPSPLHTMLGSLPGLIELARRRSDGSFGAFPLLFSPDRSRRSRRPLLLL